MQYYVQVDYTDFDGEEFTEIIGPFRNENKAEYVAGELRHFIDVFPRAHDRIVTARVRSFASVIYCRNEIKQFIGSY